MQTIITLTLNPTIDGAAEAETIRPVRKVRTSNERYDPGGGGINVARVITELGGPVRAYYLAGGATGSVLDSLLSRVGADFQRIDIAGDTRISHVVFERSTGLEYRFVPEGPRVSDAEWQKSLEILETVSFDYLVASGSLPLGVPEDYYARVSRLVAGKGARLVVDTSGKALAAALDGGGLLFAKPSLGELEQLSGGELEGTARQHEAAMAFVESGKVDYMAVTLGHHGAFLAGRDGVTRLPALPVKPRSAVGAGDSFVAAMTLRLAQGAPVEEAFMFGMAAGTAAVLTPGTELCRREDVERFYEEFRTRAG